ncbi:MAG TPA: hypothetical protein VFX59_02915 [Polyangiales bacterium]|nr:hypothetical protein [Polyangiales bacterium]
MARRAWFLVGGLLAALVHPHVVAADALRDVQDTTSSGGDSDSGSSSSSSSGGGYGSDDEQGCGLLGEASCESDDSLAFWAFAYTIGAPWTVPRIHFDDRSFGRYAAYPFADGPGLLRRQPVNTVDTTRAVAIALDVESGYMLQGVVPAGLALRVLLPYGLELDGRFNGLSDVEEHPVEVASAGTAHMTYRFAQGERYDFRTGFGVRAFALDAPQIGFDVLYGIDSYLGRRGVWRIELHLGSAGNAFVGQARSTVGMTFDRFEIYAGYDHTAYLSAESGAALGGPIGGLRAWF